MAVWRTILLLSTHPKSVAGPAQALTGINNLPVDNLTVHIFNRTVVYSCVVRDDEMEINTKDQKKETTKQKRAGMRRFWKETDEGFLMLKEMNMSTTKQRCPWCNGYRL